MKIDVERLTAGITIARVLDYLRWPHKRNRACCPIHGGNNPTAFSFADCHFKCHACGYSGDVIDLIKAMLNTDFRDACEWLACRQGIQLNLPAVRSQRKATSIPKRVSPARPKPGKLYILEADYAICQEKIEIFSKRLRRLREDRKEGKISAADFYLQQQKLDYWLEQLDTEEARLHYQINQFKRRKGDAGARRQIGAV